jgi:hypothetical protein
VQRELCGGQPVSLGSFSEAQHLTDPLWLEKLFTHRTHLGDVPAALAD